MASTASETFINASAKPANGARKDTIQSFAPATGQLIGECQVTSAEDVKRAVERARRAQEAWGALPVEERCTRMLRFRDALVDREEELTDLLAKECGKPRQEALVHEVIVVASLITHFAKHAEEVLATQEVSLDYLKHRRAFILYQPKGVVGVIAPWNFPLNLPFRDAVIALFAGNAVVIKPSEITPLIALRAKEVWDQAGLPNDLLQIVPGYGPTGAALIDAGIDLCVFTGAVATGKRVAAACGERLIPCVMELGGKAPLIACADADVERTARAAVFGGFCNSGQVCVSVERVYAHREVHDALLARIVQLTSELRQGDPMASTVDVGAMIFPKQIDIVEAHIADALAKGAKLETGGKRPAALTAAGGQFFEPTVLSGCTQDMTVMREEIFGPIVPIMRVESEEEAVRLSNDSHLGLNAYIFTKDRAHGKRLAGRVQAGSVLVNDVIANGGMPETPFGGIKDSGFGRVMGKESLREFCNVKHVGVDRLTPPSEPLWYPYTDRSMRIFRKATRAIFGGGGIVKKLSALL